jgi:hypothetical protein
MRCKVSDSVSDFFDRGPTLFGFFFFLIIFFLNPILAFSQDSFRRHFLVAYDISQEFRSLERNNIRLQRALEDLFQNLRIDNPNGNTGALITERQNGELFFDRDKDEISFYHFNVPGSEISNLGKDSFKNKTTVVNSFTKSFIRNANITWSKYKSDRGSNLIGFLFNAFNVPFNPVETSAPNLVYPLIMNALREEKPAEEYILLILTQKIPGKYNDQDVNYIRTMYPSPLADNNNAPVSVIKNQLDYLDEVFDKQDYFNYQFKTGNSTIGIYGYIVTPAGVDPGSRSPLLKPKTEIRLSQTKYRSPVFVVSPVVFSFLNSGQYLPEELFLTITRQKSDNQQVVFEDAIRYLRISGKWISELSRKLKFIRQTRKLSFKLKGLKISLKDFSPVNENDALKFSFKYKVRYNPPETNPVNYVFYSESVLPATDVNMVTFNEYMGYNFLIPGSILIIIVLFLLYYGKPKRLEFRINGYLDSILMIDYRKFGQIHTPYKFWNTQTDREDIIVVDGHLTYRSPNYLFNWNPVVILNIHELVSPEGFSMVLKPDGKAIQEYSAGNNMSIRQNKEHNLRFLICVRQNDITRRLAEPEHFKIKIEARIRQTIFLIRSKINEKIQYEFQIGNDLGDVWVGLDPGTTGSCISVGTQADDIVLGKDIEHGSPVTIIPSKLVFKTDQVLNTQDGKIPEAVYSHGVLAENAWAAAKVKFLSFKKLLGYNDKRIVGFMNHKQLELTGSDLSGLLVKGIYNDLTSFLRLSANFNFYSDVNGSRVFNPRRAVVAVPNNATLSKVQDVIDSVGYLKQFKELRYIYEAEAVLFYYLSNYSRFNPERKTFDGEVILIFDMGGATINATVVSVTNTGEDQAANFTIDILGKIGYSVGGDSIDYCLVRFILGFSDEFPELKTVSIDTHKDILLSLAREIKEIYLWRNYYYNPKEPFVIAPATLSRIIKSHLKLDISIGTESRMAGFLRKDSNNNCALFDSKLFIDIIYNNVRDAVSEVIDLSEVHHLDRLVFSGRSTFFPLIKETVIARLAQEGINAPVISLSIEESKTAVALGACWSGINKNSIRRNNPKTFASFGVKRTIGPAMSNIQYIPLIKSGNPFKKIDEGISCISEQTRIENEFPMDGLKVNFYQIMGKDADTILEKNQKHKFSKIAGIMIPQKTSSLEITVKENDEVDCTVEMVNGKKISEKGVVSDQNIAEANEDHYVWVVDSKQG